MIKDLSEDIAAFAQALRDKDSRAASHAQEMCAHGESRVGFEDLLSNLHESGAVLSEAELAHAEALTLALGQSVMQVEALRGLQVDAQGRRHAVVFTGAHFRKPFASCVYAYSP